MVALSDTGGGVLAEAPRELPPEARKRQFLDAWLDLAANENDVALIRSVALDAAKTAVTWVRQPDPSARNGWTYAPEKDHPVRLLAVNLLAEVAGLKGGKPNVALNVTDNRVSITVDDRINEMKLAGVSAEQLRAEILAVVDAAPSEAK
jgi:hypothetical protein